MKKSIPEKGVIVTKCYYYQIQRKYNSASRRYKWFDWYREGRGRSDDLLEVREEVENTQKFERKERVSNPYKFRIVRREQTYRDVVVR